MACHACKAKNALYICGRCQSIGYCSKKCQKNDWKTQHLNICGKQFTIGKEISISDASSHADTTENLEFKDLKLMTLDEEKQFGFNKQSSDYSNINPPFSLIIYKKKDTGSVSTSMYETFYSTCGNISKFTASLKEAIVFVFKQILLSNFVDFSTVNACVGKLFNSFNNLLKDTVQEISIHGAIEVADSFSKPLPVDYALQQKLFDVTSASNVKYIYIIAQPKLFNFMKELSNRYNYIARWFVQIILFKIFNEIGEERTYFANRTPMSF
jgi:hypothetical protein